MPIYEYRCSNCGHELEVLQKLSDPLLTACPECRGEKLVKQVSAAGFQLKGSGWYQTDFRNGSKPAAKSKPGDAKADGKADAKAASPDSASSSDSGSAAPSTPAAGCGSGCSCH